MAYYKISQFAKETILLSLELIQILACPTCRGELSQIGDGSNLHCKHCSKDYPIIECVPILFPNQIVTNS